MVEQGNVIAVIGDLIASRELPKRGEVQRLLRESLASVSERNSAIVSPYTITLGDEFQAVYCNATGLFLDLFTILRSLYPARARFSLGVGPLATPINPQQALGMDGPAFHRSRIAIDTLKKQFSSKARPGMFVTTAEGARQKLHLANLSLLLVSHICSRWKWNRLRTAELLMMSWPVDRIAEELNISQQAVYKAISAGAIDHVIDVLRETERVLELSMRA